MGARTRSQEIIGNRHLQAELAGSTFAQSVPRLHRSGVCRIGVATQNERWRELGNNEPLCSTDPLDIAHGLQRMELDGDSSTHPHAARVGRQSGVDDTRRDGYFTAGIGDRITAFVRSGRVLSRHRIARIECGTIEMGTDQYAESGHVCVQNKKRSRTGITLKQRRDGRIETQSRATPHSRIHIQWQAGDAVQQQQLCKGPSSNNGEDMQRQRINPRTTDGFQLAQPAPHMGDMDGTKQLPYGAAAKTRRLEEYDDGASCSAPFAFTPCATLL